MRTALVCATLHLAAAPMTSSAHGQLVEPNSRSISARFHADSGALKNAGNNELQWSPLELLSQRVQDDMPQARTFDVMNGCRGTVYEAGNPVAELRVGAAFPIQWLIQAPHPGLGKFNIVKPVTRTSGKVLYEKVVTLKSLEPFGTDGGYFSTSATIPSRVPGCETAGGCALQMHWHSEIANQTYQSCADIVITDGNSPAKVVAASDRLPPQVVPTTTPSTTATATMTAARTLQKAPIGATKINDNKSPCLQSITKIAPRNL